MVGFWGVIVDIVSISSGFAPKPGEVNPSPGWGKRTTQAGACRRAALSLRRTARTHSSASPPASEDEAPSSMTARIRRSDRDRICCTLARLSPVASAISGPLSSPPKRRAMISRSRPLSVASARSRSGSSPRSGSWPASTSASWRESSSSSGCWRAPRSARKWSTSRLRAMTMSHVPDARLRRVVARPRLQRALEGLLREVLGVGAGAQPVGEEAVDLPDVLVVNG